MLVRMTAEDILKFWPLLSGVIKDSVPPIADIDYPSYLTRFQTALLTGPMQCWGYIKGDELLGIVITEHLEDATNDRKILLIYALVGLGELEPIDFKLGFETLKEYARGIGAWKITAYTDKQEVVNLMTWLGGKSRYFLELEVNDE